MCLLCTYMSLYIFYIFKRILQNCFIDMHCMGPLVMQISENFADLFNVTHFLIIMYKSFSLFDL